MKRILAAVQLADDDASVFVDRAADWAGRLGGKLDLVTISDPIMAVDPFTGAGAATAAIENVESQRAQQDAIEELLQAVPLAVRGDAISRPGPAGTALAELTASADLLVMGTHQRTGLARFFLGSVSESVMRHANCPVLVLPDANPPAGLSEVMVPVDPYHFHADALDWLKENLPDVPRTATYALPWLEVFGPVPMHSDAVYARAQNAVREALDKAGHEDADALVSIAEYSHAGDVIVHQSRMSETSLIAMNTHGRQGLSRLMLGSVAERVIRNAEVPVLVIRTTSD